VINDEVSNSPVPETHLHGAESTIPKQKRITAVVSSRAFSKKKEKKECCRS